MNIKHVESVNFSVGGIWLRTPQREETRINNTLEGCGGRRPQPFFFISDTYSHPRTWMHAILLFISDTPATPTKDHMTHQVIKLRSHAPQVIELRWYKTSLALAQLECSTRLVRTKPHLEQITTNHIAACSRMLEPLCRDQPGNFSNVRLVGEGPMRSGITQRA